MVLIRNGHIHESVGDIFITSDKVDRLQFLRVIADTQLELRVFPIRPKMYRLQRQHMPHILILNKLLPREQPPNRHKFGLIRLHPHLLTTGELYEGDCATLVADEEFGVGAPF